MEITAFQTSFGSSYTELHNTKILLQTEIGVQAVS